jgi:hypothetical protein
MSTNPSSDDNSDSIYDLVHGSLQFSEDLAAAVEQTVTELGDVETSASRPGMLLGKVQSGKTRAFIGVIARAFDTQFDVAVILTKGTRALAQQTVKRLQKDFAPARDADLVEVYDVLPLPSHFNRWEAGRKLIFVCKKQTDNLDNLRKILLSDDYHLKGRRVLFVDDEADFASVGFRRSEGEIKVAKIASMIDALRSDLKTAGAAPAFLQVTATPYALYLQPETFEVDGKTYERTRPSFTELVPVHGKYIGGDFFFDEDHPLHGIAEKCLYPIGDAEELKALKQPDGRRVKQTTVLTAKSVATARAAVVQFIVGAAVRRLQQQVAKQKPSRYSFIVHTETGKPSHKWQAELFSWIVAALRASVASPEVESFVDAAITNLAPSVEAAGETLPARLDIHADFKKLIDAVKIEVVNSEKDVDTLLDDDGQLRLASPLNLFVGGQILDRGITVANLIGFFYGRRPKKFQQDTVLQHARIYGARPTPDLAVTRLYTTPDLHHVMNRIHEIDTALREAFEQGGHTQGVVFIQRDAKNEIVQCAPNKILLSNTLTLRPHRRQLPLGFNTRTPKSETLPLVKGLDAEIDAAVGTICDEHQLRKPAKITASTAVDWLSRIEQTIEFDPGEDFDWDAMRGALEYLASKAEEPGTVYVVVRTGRSLARLRTEGGVTRYSNAPDTSQREGKIARECSKGKTPTLMLIRQDGAEDKGWKGCPFWWPVLLPPKGMKPVIFASRTTEDEENDDEDADEGADEEVAGTV